MSKSLEQTIHDAELPAPAAGGEDFSSYFTRVAHAAAFIGAAWAIANGPQPEGPQPIPEMGEPGIPDPQDGTPYPVDFRTQEAQVEYEESHAHEHAAEHPEDGI